MPKDEAKKKKRLDADTTCVQASKPANTAILPTRLTPREIDILTWVARGKTREEISIILSLSTNSVKTYTERARRKLNAVNTTQAVVIALTLGLITPDKDMLWLDQPTHSYGL